jgi:glutamyl-tRNA reductase
MAEVTARHLLSQKANRLTISNRTFEKARELAELLSGTAIPFEKFESELCDADIVICSTSAERPLVTYEMVEPIMKMRRGRSLYFIDIAVPRNVDPRVHEIDNAYVYNVDDLKSLVDESMSRRLTEIAAAESIVQEASDEFNAWMQSVLRGETPPALRHQAPGERPA